jgi:hypothetical protein
VDLPGVGETAFGGSSAPGDGNVIAFPQGTRIMIYAISVPTARLCDLTNRLIADTRMS